MTFDRALEIFGFIVGLIYLWYEYHASSRMWIASVIMPAISMWLYYNKGLYADCAMNVYYLAIGIYGYIAWTFGLSRKKKVPVPISHITWPVAAGTALVFAAVYALIALWLVRCTDSTVPYYDAFTTALSIIATWMLARKYIEQWWAWVAVDAVCVGLYIYKGIYLYAALYAAYTLIAFFGYAKWKRLMRDAQCTRR